MARSKSRAARHSNGGPKPPTPSVLPSPKVVEEEDNNEEKGEQEEVVEGDNEEASSSRSRQGIEEPKTDDESEAASTTIQKNHKEKRTSRGSSAGAASTSSNSATNDHSKDQMEDDDDEDDDDSQNETLAVAAAKAVLESAKSHPTTSLLKVATAVATVFDDDLEEQTFHILKHYLNSTELLDVLNEEEVANRMVKTNKIAMERAKYQGNLLLVRGEDSEDDDDEEREKFFQEAYQQEEMFGLANEFFKKVISDLNEQLKRHQPETKKKSSSSSHPLPLAKLDKKAVNWLKRAMGLERNDDLWYMPAAAAAASTSNDPTDVTATNAADGGGSGGDVSDRPIPIPRYNPQRVTRGVARSTRIKRRQEKAMRETMGLQGMLQAIDELEKEHGPFVRTKKWAKQAARAAANEKAAAATNNLANNSSHHKKGKENQQPQGLIAHMPIPVEKSTDEEQVQRSLRPRKVVEQYRVVRLVRILVGRKHVRPVTRVDETKANHSHRTDEPTKKRKAAQTLENSSVDGSVTRRRLQRVPLPLYKKARLDHLYEVDSDVEMDDQDGDDDEPMPEGRLFGSIQQAELLDFSSLQRSSKDPMPLRLLNWQRRQSCSPLDAQQFRKNQPVDPKAVSKVRLPPIFTKTGVQYLPKWEDIKRLRDGRKASSLYDDPPRRRYTDAEYAQRCTQLMNALNGPARAWARYEFFYSDIDRGWYNRNDFAADVAKLGVRPNMRFTRSEWSMIRRRIPNRPRLFSKRFIFSQLHKRNVYRDNVRRVQADLEPTKNFDYEVTAPIPVGTTVTAFNKRFRVLHRGVVLFHDINGKGYLVLFERKQLGYEFCPDTEVASHGVPKIIFNPPTPMALDGSTLGPNADQSTTPGSLPCGTLLHPPNGMHPAEDVSLSNKLMDIVAKPRSKMSVSVKRQSAETSANVVKKIEEREILGRLLSTITNATKRKTMLLDAIEKYNKLEDDDDNEDEDDDDVELSAADPIVKNPERLRQHYSWLLANLETTNTTLEAAMAQMRIMYGKAYAAGTSRNQEVEHNVFALSKEALVQRASRMDELTRDLAEPWMFSVVMDCKDTGKQTATTLAAKEFGAQPGRQERHSYLQSRLASAVALLFTAAFCVERFANVNDGSNSVVAVEPVNEVFTCALEHLKLTVLPSDNSDSRVLEADASRWFEARELEEATKILYAELAACCAQQKFRQTSKT